MLLQAKNLTKYYGIREIFSKLSFSIELGEKIGLVGPNGAGKTTLLKCLTGQEIMEEGEVTLAENVKLGYLEQLPTWQEKRLIMGEMLEVFTDLIEMKRQINNLEEQMGQRGNSSEKTSKIMSRYSRLLGEYEQAGGYQYENKIKRVVKGLGFCDQDFELDIQNFSGGQKTRLNLAKILVREPEILILDEPTNHLDIKAIEWLEDYLRDYKGALLIISHDRFFLDRIVNKVLELDNRKLQIFKGNYSRYLDLKKEQTAALRKAYLKQKKEIEKTEEYIRRYKAGIKAKQARGRQSILNRLDRLGAPSKEKRMKKLQFSTTSRSGDRVLHVDGLEKEFNGKKILQGLEFTLNRGEKVGLVGANGTGKSTILKIISGLLEPSQGEFRLGSQVKVAYFAQEYESLQLDNQVIEEIIKNFDLSQEEARGLLDRFLFSGDDIFKTVRSLSGGERGRLALLKILLYKPNFLLLDEPTNHLDIPAKEAIEEALVDYEGTILVVSHDRYFLDIVVERILELSEGRIKNYLGNYTYYKKTKDDLTKNCCSSVIENRKGKKRDNSKELEDKKKNKKISVLEEDINETEEKIADLRIKLSLPEIYSNGLETKNILKEIKDLEDNLAILYGEWELLIG